MKLSLSVINITLASFTSVMRSKDSLVIIVFIDFKSQSFTITQYPTKFKYLIELLVFF